MRFLGIFALWVGLSMQASASELRVAVDIAPIHSIVAQVAGDKVRLDLIVPVNASPHDHAMRPSDAYNLSKANVVVWVGDGLTPWLEGPIENLASTARHIELLGLPETQVLPFREGAGFGKHSHGEHAPEEEHDGHDDGHSEGHEGEHEEVHENEQEEKHDDHAEGDPHVWLDPQNAIAWAYVIAGALGEEDPQNSALYEANAKAFDQRITVMSGEIAQQVEAIKDLSFIVFHDAFHNFEQRFGIEAVGAISDSDAVPPSPKRIALVRDLVAANDVQCVLSGPLPNEGLVRAVAGDVQIVEADAAGAGFDIGPQLYESLLRSIGTALTTCLSK
jgi:zinc transport system substrate-binding protein